MTADMKDRIQAFLEAGPYAVVGASIDQSKYGNMVLRCYQQHGKEVYPINARAAEVEGLKAYPDLASVPTRLRAISIITPPKVTEQVVREAAAVGVRYVWMQPGAESDEAVKIAEELGLEVISGGPCLLVVAGFHGGH
ncbi:CoA-binding protein [Holophaga foetida]|uniref:CoA-binding protein n=1 Tax=Holophaga foetida TaxID=35839 RepID=UPI00024749CF|nr:CoA-binding protein [Holophaga foetida]